MQNKTILITGGTGGIGKQTALALARTGARIIVIGRSQANGETAVNDIKQLSNNSKMELLLADISTQKGIHALAAQFSRAYDHLDVLINNAGQAASTRQLTEDEVESNFAVNVITPFLLTHLLMERLKASASARVINLTGGEAKGEINLENLQAERSFDGLNSYSHSKLVMMALMYEFAQKIHDANVTINVCYPGQASTNMTRGVTPGMLPGFMRVIWPLFRLATREDGGKSAEKASRSSVYLAVSPEVEGVTGKYFDTNSKIAAWPKAIMDESTRKQIWTTAEHVSHLI